MKAKVKKTTNPGSEQADLPRLAGLVKTYAPYDGSFETKVPGVHVFRRSKMNTEKLHVFAQASLCVVAQGAKTVMLDKEVFEYDASKMIVYSLDMPVTIQVTQASFAEPLLGVRVDLDPQKVAELTLKVYPHGLPPVRENRAIYVGHSDPKIVQAAVRLLELIPQPEEAQIIGSLVVDEILIRLLRSPLGPRVAQIGLKDSGLHGVSKAVNWLRNNYYPTHQDRGPRQAGQHERFHLSRPLQVGHRHEPPAVPKGSCASRRPGGSC